MKINDHNELFKQKEYLEHVFLPAIIRFKKKHDIPIYLDMANDDFMGARKPLEEQNGKLLYLLHMGKYPLADSVDIIGYMAVPPTPFGRKDWEKPDSKIMPHVKGNQITLNGYVSSSGELVEMVLDLESDDTIENDLSILSKKIDKSFIFIAHCPPYHTPLDMLFDGSHVGSISIRNFIEKWSESGCIIASLHGHIHESPSISGFSRTTIGTCPCVNPGQGAGEKAVFRFAMFEIVNRQKPTVHFL